MARTAGHGILLPEQAQRTLHLPLRVGGLGLRSAVASWADCLPAIRARALEVAVRNLQVEGPEAAAPLAAAEQGAPELHLSHLDAASAVAGRATRCTSPHSLPNLPGASGLLAAVPGYPATTLATVAACGATRMRLSGARPGRLCKRGRACFPRFAPRTGSRALLPRSWRSGSAERASGGHEHRCAGFKRPPHRSCCQWAPALARFLNRPLMPCTIISPVTRAGEAQPGADVRSGQA